VPQEGQLESDPRIVRGVHGAVAAQGDDGVRRGGVRPRLELRCPDDVQRVPARRGPLAQQAGRRVGLLLDDEQAQAYPFTRKAPRMNGWMRQKKVYVPGCRSAGVCHSLRFEAAVKPGGPKPSSPESKTVGPLASG
jgi:hypothetical protein